MRLTRYNVSFNMIVAGQLTMRPMLKNVRVNGQARNETVSR